MNSSKKLNVGVSSSLIDLKAELLRKQGELKATSRDKRGSVFKSLKKTDILKAKSKYCQKNAGVDKRSQRDLEEIAEEEKNIEKSKNVLEAKARLYDKMQAEALTLDDDDDTPLPTVYANSLVNFQQKAVDEVEERKREVLNKRHVEEDKTVHPDNDNDEWEEFTDALGRTRKCLKADLPSFLERDDKLSRPENPGICLSTVADERLREMKRAKWDEEAELITFKDRVHYQDILYDEVRDHGTGYYKFSHDEQTREKQMRDLKKLSEQTEATRQKIGKEKSDKKSQLKARLKKIKDKQRAKKGLPPLPDESDEEEVEEEPITQEEEEEDKPKEIRAWDVGKSGVYGPRPLDFDELDEKWLRDRRADRNPDFAPPTSVYSQGGLKRQNHNQFHPPSSPFASTSSEKYSNFVKSAPQQSTSPSPPVVVEPPPKPFCPPDSFWKQRKPPPPQAPVPIRNEVEASAPIEDTQEDSRDRCVEVAPPPTFEYYHGNTSKPQRAQPPSRESMMDAVSSGLKHLREKFETRKLSSKEFTEEF